MVGYLFAGQGCQYIGMGKDLYDAFPESKAVFDKADKFLGFSLSSLCFEGPQEELTKTNNSQPAILTVSIAVLEAFKKVNGSGVMVDGYAAGLSLGEYSALVAAGAIKFEDAVYLVRRRGELMEEEATRRPGKMLSIIGLDLAAVKDICACVGAEVANINCPGQTVISGGIKEIERAKGLAEERQAKMAIVLEVSGAFHSSFMKNASLKFRDEIDKVKIDKPRIPVVSNVSAKPVTSALEIKENLVRQIVSSVLWEDSMKFILSEGVRNFVEFGPGKVLKGLMRRIDSNAQVASIENKEDIQGVKQNET